MRRLSHHVSQRCSRCNARPSSHQARPPAPRAAPTATHMTSTPPLTPSNQPSRSFSNSPPRASQTSPQESERHRPKQDSPLSASVPQTHYQLFPKTLPHGPPPSSPFPINTRALRSEFLALQSRYHPDLHPAATKARAEATSALINEAYRTLSNPLLRAQYLLSLRGVNVADDETLKVEEPELLMQVLEAREEIEEAEAEEELEGQRTQNEERIRNSEEVLQDAFQKDDMDLAKREAVRLRYWVNIRESLDNWEKGKPIVLEH